MKKLLTTILVVLTALVVVVLPAGADDVDASQDITTQEGNMTAQGNIAYLDGAYSHEWFDYRYDLLEGNAFQNAVGITTAQLSAGNGNIIQANTHVAALVWQYPTLKSDSPNSRRGGVGACPRLCRLRWARSMKSGLHVFP